MSISEYTPESDCHIRIRHTQKKEENIHSVAFIQGEHRQLSKAIETMQNPLFCVNSVYLELAILQDFAENMIES